MIRHSAMVEKNRRGRESVYQEISCIHKSTLGQRYLTPPCFECKMQCCHLRFSKMRPSRFSPCAEFAVLPQRSYFEHPEPPTNARPPLGGGDKDSSNSKIFAPNRDAPALHLNPLFGVLFSRSNPNNGCW